MYSNSKLKGIRIVVREAQEMGLKMLGLRIKRERNCIICNTIMDQNASEVLSKRNKNCGYD